MGARRKTSTGVGARDCSCEGIYYVVRYPAGWELLVTRFDQGVDTNNHYDWWETSVAGTVAAEWAKRLRVMPKKLEQELAVLTYAFPRGRISKVGRRFLVLQSGDITPAMSISKDAIEAAFGIAGQCSWQFDEHERCIEADRDEMRRILGIREDWNAV